jgi:hypothetical protein
MRAIRRLIWWLAVCCLLAGLAVSQGTTPSREGVSDAELEQLYEAWLTSLREPETVLSSGARQTSSPYFTAMVAKGPTAVPFMIAKLDSAPTPDVASFLMTSLSRITHARPFSKEEARRMSTDAKAKAWVTWFRTLDENVNRLFREKAVAWLSFAGAREPTLWSETTFYDPRMGELQTRRELTEAGKAYEGLLDLGIPILPLLVERLRAGQTCFIPVFEELTKSGAVVHGPNAETTSRNCVDWWERNKEDWVIRSR